jgi:uncharacterized membrane protein
MALTLCNGYPALISTAICFYSPDTCGGEGDNFEMMGWWNIEPGACALVYGDDLEDLNRYWYYYADAGDGAVWSGPYGASVPLAAFDQCYGIGVIIENNHESIAIGFRELDIGDNDDYTLTFVP